jgi:hypothetical protein
MGDLTLLFSNPHVKLFSRILYAEIVCQITGILE